MKLPIYNTKNQKTGEKQLPLQFKEAVRTDLITKAVLAIQLRRKQVYGAHPMAGKNTSVRLSKRRRDYRGSYGKGQSRIPRKVMTRRGTQFNMDAAFAPGTVKGRRAHPPKSEKKIIAELNSKEELKALRSALGATLSKEMLQKRNHLFPDSFPFLLADEFEEITKTKKLFEAMKLLGFEEELKRTKKRKIRAGKGKMRGRKYSDKKGPLIIVSKNCPLSKSGKNIKGCNVVQIRNLTCEDLAPGTQAGRLALFTESAINALEREKLFFSKPESQNCENGKKEKKEPKKGIQKSKQKNTLKKSNMQKAPQEKTSPPKKGQEKKDKK